MDKRATLKKNYEFRRLYTKGKSVVTPCMVVYSLRNANGSNRVGYTVSTKLGHAVVRNRVRRRLREIYRLNSHRLQTGHDIVIVARTKSVGADYARLEETFLRAARELKLLKEDAAQ